MQADGMHYLCCVRIVRLRSNGGCPASVVPAGAQVLVCLHRLLLQWHSALLLRCMLVDCRSCLHHDKDCCNYLHATIILSAFSVGVFTCSTQFRRQLMT